MEDTNTQLVWANSDSATTKTVEGLDDVLIVPSTSYFGHSRNSIDSDDDIDDSGGFHDANDSIRTETDGFALPASAIAITPSVTPDSNASKSESPFSAAAPLLHPRPTVNKPTAPPALPPRDAAFAAPLNSGNNNSISAAKSLKSAASFVSGAASKLLAKVSDRAADRNLQRVQESRAFNKEILSRIPLSIFHATTLRQPRNGSQIKFLTVELFKVPSIIESVPGVSAVAAKMSAAAAASNVLDSGLDSADPAGEVSFVNVDMISCLIYKQPPRSDRSINTIVVLKKDFMYHPNTLLRLPHSTPQFPDLAPRLPASFVILPLVTDFDRRTRRTSTTNAKNESEFLKSKIAINTTHIVSISPFDLDWTNVVVLGHVRPSNSGSRATSSSSVTVGNTQSASTAATTSQYSADNPISGNQHQYGVSSANNNSNSSSSLQATAKRVLDSAAARVKESAATVSSTVIGGNSGGTFAFQVALDYVSLLKILDPDSF
ncbi:hypothetical protein HK100_002235 [Physocladia obscura]|uniref:Uncharacterized protein n=1 Tax=Physocladia obscura TaxID=109957 RepID=A0AAD5SY97_9FUNG|nr:hypothetical protein HK100_002235 [Physocladia obscura]